jgi:D-arabinose 1-dehydrogenase-like Zn-dependent alcohol dehydrogenase
VHCHGGYAEQILVPHARYLVDIGDADAGEMAPYACSGLTTYSALKKIPSGHPGARADRRGRRRRARADVRPT